MSSSQRSWNWCNKCQGLVLADAADAGACAAGGSHDFRGSGDYSLVPSAVGAAGERQWRRCNKCHALTFGGAATAGRCPGGGEHRHDDSDDYLVGLAAESGQAGWRRCRKCQMICYAPREGCCPSGGVHDCNDSQPYFLGVLRRSGPVDWCRKVMSDQVFDFVSTLPTESMDALEVSGTAWHTQCKWKSYQAVAYPAFDLCHDIVPDRKFDIVLLEQVLEHVRYPYRAVRNIYRMLRDNGWAVATTPFLVQVHLREMDYTRWTPDGLKYLLEEGGFPALRITTGSWGNRACAIADFNSCADGKGWHTYDPARHSLVNEPDYPIVVWAMAQKCEGL